MYFMVPLAVDSFQKLDAKFAARLGSGPEGRLEAESDPTQIFLHPQTRYFFKNRTIKYFLSLAKGFDFGF